MKTDQADELLEAVTVMRRLQKEFFKTRDSFSLRESKQAEKHVDAILTAIRNQAQGELF